MNGEFKFIKVAVNSFLASFNLISILSNERECINAKIPT